MDLRQIDPADYRARVGFVSQDPRLFNGTLRDNVLLDRPAADPARLAEVARLTGLDRLIAAPPAGLGAAGGRGRRAAVGRPAPAGGAGALPGDAAADPADGRAHQRRWTRKARWPSCAS
jgi:ABC-type protease/lipase transport system fused ATPase/permease subunit